MPPGILSNGGISLPFILSPLSSYSILKNKAVPLVFELKRRNGHYFPHDTFSIRIESPSHNKQFSSNGIALGSAFTTGPEGVTVKEEPIDSDEADAISEVSGNVKYGQKSSKKAKTRETSEGIEKFDLPLVFMSKSSFDFSKYKDSPHMFALQQGSTGEYVTKDTVTKILCVKLNSTYQATLTVLDTNSENSAEKEILEVPLRVHVQVEYSNNKGPCADETASSLSIDIKPEIMPIILDVVSGDMDDVMDKLSQSQSDKPANPILGRDHNAFQRKFLKMLKEIRQEQKEQRRLLNQLIKTRDEKSIPVDCPKLPAETAEELSQFEKYLQVRENFIQTCSAFGSYGGFNFKDAVRRMLLSIMTNGLSGQYNWKGSGGVKLSFSHFTNIIKLISTSVRQNSKYMDSTNREVEAFIKRWLASAKDRDGGRAKRRRRAM